MSESPSRRAAGRPPGDGRGGRGRPDGYGRQPAPGQGPWEPQPRTAQRPPRDDRAPRGYDDGGYGQQGQQPRSGGRGRPAGYDDGYAAAPAPAPAPPRGRGSRGRAPADEAGYERYDGDPRDADRDDGYGDGYDDNDGYDEAPGRGGSRRAGAARSGGSRSGGGSRRAGAPVAAGAGGAALPLGPRLGMGFAIGAVPALVIAFLCGMLSSGGSSRSIAGVTLNSQLLSLSALAIPAMILIIGGLLRWRQLNPLGLTWGFAVVSGLSWLALLFAAQVKNVIPHLTPLVTVPLVTGAAVAAAAYLTDENTTPTGRYACLAAVIASHIGIVAIVVTIVLA
ncbi:hypothetical protein KGQ20_01700 [Catenulispora sp. NF23]|uniref:hypothetical protein n=1 Tax=Catenulispora pinistramenti TaxID=2705254 RepID=UPI001BA72699|nr:hypothetical protein [Catenulispora pinistramenti]MBS2531477.1 hypothetical protein [Catenulispora pinistramenti]